MPTWEALTEADKERIILSTDDPVAYAAGTRLRKVLDSGRDLLPLIRDEYGRDLAKCVRFVTDLVAWSGLVCSPRRQA
jgi:hypothetical protein